MWATLVVSVIEEMSSLSLKEVASLKGSLIALSEPKFSCDSCLSEYSHRADGDVMTGKSRAAKGCEAPVNYAVKKSDGLTFKKCPGNFVNEAASSWVGVVTQLEKGIMPYDGAYLTWPAKGVEILNIISAHRTTEANRRRSEEQARQRAQLQSTGGANGKR